MNKLLVSRNENGTVTTTSLKIAEVFGKKHKNILRDIENLLKEIPQEWGRLNFEQTPYVHPQNGESYSMYLLTRDAFTLLAMGFTGREALQWKLKYIEAFNAMEDRLKELAAEQRKIRQEDMHLPLRVAQVLGMENSVYSTTVERKNLRMCVNILADIMGVEVEVCYRLVHKKFNISSIRYLLKKDVENAEFYLVDLIDYELVRRGTTLKKYFHLE